MISCTRHAPLPAAHQRGARPDLPIIPQSTNENVSHASLGTPPPAERDNNAALGSVTGTGSARRGSHWLVAVAASGAPPPTKTPRGEKG